MSSTLECKDIGIRKSEFVAKTHVGRGGGDGWFRVCADCKFYVSTQYKHNDRNIKVFNANINEILLCLGWHFLKSTLIYTVHKIM